MKTLFGGRRCFFSMESNLFGGGEIFRHSGEPPPSIHVHFLSGACFDYRDIFAESSSGLSLDLQGSMERRFAENFIGLDYQCSGFGETSSSSSSSSCSSSSSSSSSIFAIFGAFVGFAPSKAFQILYGDSLSNICSLSICTSCVRVTCAKVDVR